MRHECYNCHKKTVQNLIEKFQPAEHVARDLTNSIEHILEENKDLPNPYLAALIHRTAREKIDHLDLYETEKHHANAILLNNYDHWKKLVIDSPDPFHFAAKLAVAGNIIDYGAHTAETEVEEQIMSLVHKPFVIDDVSNLHKEINAASSVLYLADNAGEMIFDKLFIETFPHHNVIYAVRGQSVINDVTMKDAEFGGLREVARVVSNGNDAPSTIPELCSDEFLDYFHHSDVIISKGQGNFEGLMNSGKDNIFYMLMAKCDPIAELLNVKNGSMMVRKNSIASNVM